MKKIIFIFGIMFGLGINFITGYFLDLIFLLNLPAEASVPNVLELGAGIICCFGSAMMAYFLPEDVNVAEEEQWH